MSDFVKYKDFDSTRIITIDRSEKKNALNSEMLEEMCLLIENVENNQNIRSIIITAQGDKIFSSGYDISSDSAKFK